MFLQCLQYLTSHCGNPRGKGADCLSRSFNARSVIAGQAQGMVKIVASKPTGRILGVHILAPMASEVIAEATLALRLEALAEDLAAIVHGHPTVAEALSEAAQEVVRQL